MGDSGSAVVALRTKVNDRLFLVRSESVSMPAEANLRGTFVTPQGDLRVALHRGRFSSPEAEAEAAAACAATASAVADVGADVLGRSRSDRPSPDLGEQRWRGSEMRVCLERPADEPAFADELVAALAHRDPALAARVAVVADLEAAAPAERARYVRGMMCRQTATRPRASSWRCATAASR